MATTRKTLLPKIQGRIQDTAGKLTEPNLDACVDAALVVYAQDRPRVAYQDYAGDGNNYAFALPTGWESGMSTCVSVEWPAGQRIASFLEADQYTIRQWSATEQKLVLTEVTPAANETLRVGFTLPHQLAESGNNASTIAVSDEEAFCDLAASLALDRLAALYVQVGDPLIGADMVNYRSKAEEYTSLAKAARKRYTDHMARGGGEQPTAGPTAGWIDWDLRQQYGSDYVYHDRNTR